MFFVIEGIDGSGKGTQLRAIEKELKRAGKKVLTLDFPRYEEPSSYFVRQYLNGEYGDSVSSEISSMFYALDRYEALQGYDQMCQDYDIILSNRYVSSNMIHQGAKHTTEDERRQFFAWVHHLEHETLQLPEPDLIFFLDVPPAVSQKLIEKKEQRDYIKGGENKDIHEKDDSHLRNAYACCHQLVAQFDNWKHISCVDAEKEILPIDSITQILLDTINAHR